MCQEEGEGRWQYFKEDMRQGWKVKGSFVPKQEIQITEAKAKRERGGVFGGDWGTTNTLIIWRGGANS